MNILKVIRAVLKQPTNFYQKVGQGKNCLGFAFGYFALLSVFSFVMSWITSFVIIIPLIKSFLPAFPLVGDYLGMNFFSSIFSFVLTLGLSFVYAGLLHLWILIFRGKNTYTKTYELGAYAGTPSMLFGWIPVLGWIGGTIWSLILLIIGTQHVHGISKRRAVLMYVIPLAIIMLLVIAVWIFIIFFFIKNIGTLGGLAALPGN